MIGIDPKQGSNSGVSRAAAQPKVVAHLLFVQPTRFRELAQCPTPHSDFPLRDFGVQDH